MKASYCTFAYEGRQVLKNKNENKRTKHCDTVISKKGDLPTEKIHMVGFKLKQGEKNVVLINGFHFEHAKNSLDKSRDKILQEKPFDINCSVLVFFFFLPIRQTAVHFQTLHISTLYVTKLIKFL